MSRGENGSVLFLCAFSDEVIEPGRTLFRKVHDIIFNDLVSLDALPIHSGKKNSIPILPAHVTLES